VKKKLLAAHCVLMLFASAPVMAKISSKVAMQRKKAINKDIQTSTDIVNDEPQLRSRIQTLKNAGAHPNITNSLTDSLNTKVASRVKKMIDANPFDPNVYPLINNIEKIHPTKSNQRRAQKLRDMADKEKSKELTRVMEAQSTTTRPVVQEQEYEESEQGQEQESLWGEL
jgi:hypothetical protein